MHTLFESEVAFGIAIGSAVLILVVLIGRKFFGKAWRYNKKHHLIAFNDNSVDSLYAWDEDDDL